MAIWQILATGTTSDVAPTVQRMWAMWASSAGEILCCIFHWCIQFEYWYVICRHQTGPKDLWCIPVEERAT